VILAHAYARAARALGARFSTGVAVNRIEVTHGRASGVETSQGRVSAAAVVVAAGAWSNLLTVPLGCALPTAPVRSEYWITAPAPAFPRGHPVVILPDARAYSRPELGGLLFGLRGLRGVAADPRVLPDDAAGFAIPDAEDTLAEGADALTGLCPPLVHAGIAHAVEGLSTYTPDGAFVLGAAPGITGLFVATGCCGAGIAASGGIGLALASVMLNRDVGIDLTAFAPGRFGVVDPFDPTFRARCAAARAQKTAG
jgi:sarcosine oxidase subunit beta